MPIPNLKALERVWGTSVLFAVFLAGFVAIVGFSAIGGIEGLNDTVHNVPIAMLVFEGVIFCLLYFGLAYVASSFFFYLGCKLACPDIKPFVNGIIGLESTINSSYGHRFTTNYVSFYSKTLGRMVNVYFYKTGSKEIDKYLAKYVNSRDISTLLLTAVLLSIAMICFDIIKNTNY